MPLKHTATNMQRGDIVDIQYNWSSQQNPEIRDRIEEEIARVINDRNIKPCHSNTILVSLGINGPLNSVLRGSAACECGKVLLGFRGDDRASRLTLIEYET